MKTVTIPEMEYLKMKQLIAEMQQQLSLLHDKDFLQKLNLALFIFVMVP